MFNYEKTLMIIDIIIFQRKFNLTYFSCEVN